MSNHLTPLDVCICVFGGRSEVERIAGSRPKGSYAWSKPAAWRRAGDLPPHVARKMLAAARRRGIAIDPAWLIEGAATARVHALVENMAYADPQVAAE